MFDINIRSVIGVREISENAFIRKDLRIFKSFTTTGKRLWNAEEFIRDVFEPVVMDLSKSNLSKICLHR